MLCISTSERMLAHAFACVRMVENDQKHSKMSKKVPFSSCVREAYERLTNKNQEKSLLVSDWDQIVSKYTTYKIRRASMNVSGVRNLDLHCVCFCGMFHGSQNWS